jgi:hypothetical protein
MRYVRFFEFRLKAERGKMLLLVVLLPLVTTCSVDTFGSSEKCNTALQNCPDGKKCRHEYDRWDVVADEERDVSESGVCVPIVGRNRFGEACNGDYSKFADGVYLDDCDKGLWCQDNGGAIIPGRCDRYCDTFNQCSAGLRLCQILSSSAAICADCDPINQDCLSEQRCIYDRDSEHFVCNDTPLNLTNRSAPCDDPLACDKGLFCSYNVLGCPAQGCCTPFCRPYALNEYESPCTEGEVCLPITNEISTDWISGNSIGICVGE